MLITYSYTFNKSNDYSYYIEHADYITQLYNYVYQYYSDYYKVDKPYYLITLYHNGDHVEMKLYAFTNTLSLTYGKHPTNPSVYSSITSWTRVNPSGEVFGDYNYDNGFASMVTKSVYINTGKFSSTTYSDSSTDRGYYGFDYYDIFYSNFDINYNPSPSSDIFIFNINNKSYTYSPGDVLASMSSYYNFYPFNDPDKPSDKFTEVDLNNYSYIALSLKDYSLTKQTTSIIYTKGQLCLTPVYSYGMKEKKDYYNSYQVQGCTVAYDNFTPVRISILSQDYVNHAIYYIKSYNTNIDNIIKIDSSLFNITYFDSSNENNPSVIIDGKSYPTIPYSELTDTSTKSEEEGYIPGVSCQVGDLNCSIQNSSNSFDDLFSNPLSTLSNVGQLFKQSFQ